MPRVDQPERQPFYCPYPGCKRKFASLWRLKVHYRAPPNERGSGKERGHGVELPICPACNEKLEPGKHHNKCKAGRTTNPPSKRAPKSAAGSNRSSKSARSSSKRFMSKDDNATIAAENARADALADPLDIGSHSPTFRSRCIPHHIEEVDVAQGAYMMPPMFSCPAGVGQSSQVQQTQRAFPGFEYSFPRHLVTEDDALGHDSGPSSHDIGPQAHPDEARADTFPMPLNAAQALSAQGAAKVLYTIARSDADAPPDGSDSAAPLATSHPHYALSPISDGSHGNNEEAEIGIESERLGTPGSPGTVTAMPVVESTASPGQTAAGVPIGMMGGANVPLLFPWGAQCQAEGQQQQAQSPAPQSQGQPQQHMQSMQLVMAPQGLFPLDGRSQFLVPVQTIKGPGGEDMTVVMPQEACCMPGAGSSYMSAPVVLSTDGLTHYVAEGHPMCMPILHVPERGNMCNVSPGPAARETAQAARGHVMTHADAIWTDGGATPHCRISEEDFMCAIRMASATEVSATS